MKKFFFTSLLTIASSLWAFCNASVQLPSLCDEWHLETWTVVDPDNPDYHEYTQRLAADTIIGGKQYRQLRGMRVWTPINQNDNNYLGALREGNNADIYYVPAGSTHEYLLYAFNVQVGDTLTNLWIDNHVSEPYGYKAKVTGVGTGKFKRIDLHVFDTDDNKGVDCWADTHWLDSIGRYTGPVWADPVCYAIDPAPEVICACKEGRKVYARDANCKCSPFRLSSLCDTWNVLDFRYNWGYGDDEYILHHYHLTTDTVINTLRYVKLYKDNSYRGALREGNNAKIYYIPADSTGEYLLYDFNVQVGDTLDNLWYDHSTLSFSRVRTIVTEIQETLPRTIVLTVNIFFDDNEGVERLLDQQQLYWIEGVGHANAAPDSYGWLELAGGYITNLQCAYKDGELVYASGAFDGYGCSYNESVPVTQATQWYGVLYEAYPYWPGFTEPRLSDANYLLQGDTVISGKTYSRLCEGSGNYVGAIRFSPSGRQAYYVPIYHENWPYFLEDGEFEFEEGAEYLLYDLNVSVGDTVKAFSSTVNLPCGRAIMDDWIVLDVRTIDGRIHARVKGGSYDTETEWIEGIGTPYIVWSGERDCQPMDGSTVRPYTLCAADSDGNILYSFNLENIGVRNECPYWSRIGDESASDTIPLYRYTGDDPGSSTVDPVDPNQVVVILQGDELTIREFSGDEIGYTLTNMHTANAPARNRSAQADTFRNSVSVQLTEDGRYTLNLTNPEWGYNIYGTFDYGRDAFVPVTSETVATKILHNGRLLIQYDGKTFTLTGLQVE